MKKFFQSIFGDNDDFVNYYFERRHTLPQTYAITENGDTIASLHIFDITIALGEKKLKSALISGVGTSPQYRRKGYMDTLIRDCLHSLTEKEYDIAILSPVDSHYYKKYGFLSAQSGEWKKIDCNIESEYSLQECSISDIPQMLEIYNAIACNRQIVQVIDSHLLHDLFDDFSCNDNAHIFYITSHNKPIGWICCGDKKVDIAVVDNTQVLTQIKSLNEYEYFQEGVGNVDIFQWQHLNYKGKLPCNNCMIINKY